MLHLFARAPLCVKVLAASAVSLRALAERKNGPCAYIWGFSPRKSHHAKSNTDRFQDQAMGLRARILLSGPQ